MEGKGCRRGTQRRFEHRHSVYIYQNFFAFDRAIAIKMCSCNHRRLSSLCVCVLFFIDMYIFYKHLKSPKSERKQIYSVDREEKKKHIQILIILSSDHS